MNVVLVVSDTFRYDNLSCYGAGKALTPRLDRFAQQACVFENAYLGSFPTIPARLDITSGQFSGIYTDWCPLPHETVTLQQILSASGVMTELVVDNPHFLEAGYDYARGFDGFEWIRGQEGDPWKTGPRNVTVPAGAPPDAGLHSLYGRIRRNSAHWTCEEDRYTPRSIMAACEWLEDNQDYDKFFLQIELFDPHQPWEGPQHYVDLYDPGYPGPEILYPPSCFWRDVMSEAEHNHVYAEYRGEVSLVDRWFGVLLDKLDQLGLSEDTAVIFTSDHGYLFGEHGISGKSLMGRGASGRGYETTLMYNDIRRVPLLVRLPGQQEAKRIRSLAQLPDLMPTILEMEGLVASESIAGQSEIKTLQCGVFAARDWKFEPSTVHGKSLLPLMRGEAAKLRDIAVASNTLVYHSPIIAKSAIITEDGWCLHYAGHYPDMELGKAMWKLPLVEPEGAVISFEPHLFNLREDPGEERNVIQENLGLAREIHGLYVKWLEEIKTPAEHVAGRRELGV